MNDTHGTAQLDYHVAALCAGLVRSLTDLWLEHPNAMTVDVQCASRIVAVSVTPHRVDAGQIIGKKGHIHDALVTLLNQVVRKHGYDSRLFIVSERDKAVINRMPRRENPETVETGMVLKIAELFHQTCCSLLTRCTTKHLQLNSSLALVLSFGSEEPLLVSMTDLRGSLEAVFLSIGRRHGLATSVSIVEEK